jgi:hypothetical protein
MSEPVRNQVRLTLAEVGQGRILAALEASLGDPGRLTVADQDKGRNQSLGELDAS